MYESEKYIYAYQSEKGSIVTVYHYICISIGIYMFFKGYVGIFVLCSTESVCKF